MWYCRGFPPTCFGFRLFRSGSLLLTTLRHRPQPVTHTKNITFFDFCETDLYRSLTSEQFDIDCHDLFTWINGLNNAYGIFPYACGDGNRIPSSKSISSSAGLIPSGAISSSVSGTGLDPGPTNPVTPLVFLTTYQVSSFMTMCTST